MPGSMSVSMDGVLRESAPEQAPPRRYSEDIGQLLEVGGDDEADMEERLNLLETAVLRNAEILQSMRRQNRNLESSVHEAKKGGDEDDRRTKMLIQQLSTRVINKELRTLSDDVYSFLFCSKPCSVPSWIGMITVFIQFAVFALFLGDLLNTQEIPPNVETMVRVGQAGAILICFMAQTDVRTSLRALIYQEGVENLEIEFGGFTSLRFIVGNILMLLQGLLGTVVSIFLIVYSDNVFDLLLNFTAVMFVSELDELVFYMARNAYLGVKAEKLAEDIQKCEFSSQEKKGISGYMHVILFVLLVIAGYVWFAIIIGMQVNNAALPVYVKAEFGDAVDPTLGLYSGCYKMVPQSGWSERVSYEQVQTERGQGRFTYCYGETRSWTFSPIKVPVEYACEENDEGEYGPTLRSDEERPTSFDLLDAKGDQWKLKSGNPIQSFQLVEIEEDRVEVECGDEFGGADREVELCPILTMLPSFEGFSDDRDWSRSYNEMLVDGKTVYFYQHPIYVGEYIGEKEGLELIFFTGRRWLSTTAKGLLTQADEDAGIDLTSEAEILALMREKTGVTDFRLLSLERGAYAFISEAVDQANDRGTPLGLRWYHSRYGDNGADSFPFADISRPADALFSCGKCDSERNPCRFEGVCRADGTCDCKHGATGKLCEIKPLGDGICHPYFNKGPDGFDGGDCCVSTCEGVSCGVGDMTEAFGQELRRSGNGFPYCIDPEMVPLTITMNHTIDPGFYAGFLEDSAGGTFESYFVEVSCHGGDEIPLRVALNPENPKQSSQTLFVADQMDGCEISFLGIQSTSLFNATFQLIDGYPEDAEGVVVASAEMRDVTNVTKDATFTIPTLYAKCLKETLKGLVDTYIYYSGTYQDEAMSWLNEEIKGGRCVNDEEWRIQRYALVALWRAEGSPVEWVNKNDHCLWSRINCRDSFPVVITHDGDTTGRLTGTLATEIGLLTHLERLDVFTNDLTGTLPTELGLLTKLTFLGYAENSHSGTIPSEVGQLKALEELMLWHNQLTGSIPSEVGLLSNLGQINLQENLLYGSLPSELGALTKLTRLTLHTNALSGSLPNEIGSMTSLTNIVMTRNYLSGPLPDLSKLSNLDTLIFFTNELSGSLPTSISNLPNLYTLNLSTNKFSGSIPTEWSGLSSLYWMILNKNQLTGTIPDFLGTLGPNFSRLVLDDNQLVGSIPDSFANLSNMARLRLQNNQLTGELKPEVVGGWTSMGQLYLSFNQFIGTLPTEIGLLSSMDYFEASDNNLRGKIPDELWTVTNLGTLYLNNNQLTGSIPTEIGLLSNMLYMDLSGNNLTGTIPSEIASMPNLSWFQILNGNNFTGTVPQEICDVLTANEATSDVMDFCASGASIGAEPVVEPAPIDTTP